VEKLQTNVDVQAAYGIMVEFLNSKEKALPATFLTRAIIASGTRTKKHSHFEKEFFVVLSGEGSLLSSLNSLSISKGDLVSVNAFSEHEIVNTAKGDLEILSLSSTQKDRPALPDAMLITTAPPTPNGPLHLGHASGPYLGADLLARYLRKRNVKVKTAFYTDDHQTYVLAKAETLNRGVDEVAARYRAEILQGLHNLGIHYDEFLDVRNNSFYKQKTQLLFENLLAKDLVKLEDTQLPYCLHCQEILIDAFLSGKCPDCGHASSGSCEGCGHYHSPDQILDAACAKCKIIAHSRDVKVARLDLEIARPFIQKFVEETHMNHKLRERSREILSHKLPKLIITHPGNYGISTHHPQLLGQVFHVWFEMAAGLDFLRQKNPDSNWAHFFGFDNAFFYAIAIPALLELSKANYPHPTHLYANEFLELDGKKFSTSRSHALWVNEETNRMGSDFLRLALNYQSPQNSPTSVSLEHLLDEREKIGAQFERLLSMAEIVKDAPDLGAKKLSPEEQDFYINIHLRVREAEEALHPLYFNRRNAVRAALRLMLEIEDFKKDFMRSKNGAQLIRTSLKALGQIMSLLAPEFSGRVAHMVTLAESWERDFS
jgi:methionyl-tRNA synthetase